MSWIFNGARHSTQRSLVFWAVNQWSNAAWFSFPIVESKVCGYPQWMHSARIWCSLRLVNRNSLLPHSTHLVSWDSISSSPTVCSTLQLFPLFLSIQNKYSVETLKPRTCFDDYTPTLRVGSFNSKQMSTLHSFYSYI
jgi:hypothetical protein